MKACLATSMTSMTSLKGKRHMRAAQVGIWSGILATGAMTLALFKLMKIPPTTKDSPLPPTVVTGEVAEPLGLDQSLSQNRRSDMTMISHFGYGVAAAEVFSFLQKKMNAPPIALGLLYGATVWGASYFGLLPAMGSRASAFRMSPIKNLDMLLAHLVWGASLGYSEHELRTRGEALLAAR
jgi:uncharacterized membrane protein YagU involved in acid resistance